MGYIGALLVVGGIIATVYINFNLYNSKLSTERRSLIVLLGILGCVLGTVLLFSGDEAKRCDQFTAQGKRVLLVDGICWVSLGNDLFIQSDSKQTEIKTRAELTAE